MDKKVTLAQLKEVVQEAYDQVKTNTGGKNADYIPYLANVNKDLFGISVCLLNGQTIHVGDTDYRFGIESVSKVHTAILALRQYCAKEILDKIGADATGLPYNSSISCGALPHRSVTFPTMASHFLAESPIGCTILQAEMAPAFTSGVDG